jgi:hypothetical protein
LGYFFLPAPPQEAAPMPDFRSVGRGTPRLSADLLDVIYTCQTRQSWYREEVLVNGGTPLPFVGSASLGTEPEQAARLIREALHFSTQTRSECVSWSDALRLFIAQAEHFYRTTIARVGKRFAQTLVASTLEGRTLYGDAFRMRGISSSTREPRAVRAWPCGFKRPPPPPPARLPTGWREWARKTWKWP